MSDTFYIQRAEFEDFKRRVGSSIRSIVEEVQTTSTTTTTTGAPTTSTTTTTTAAPTYLVYTVLLTQVGTNAPTATVLENTFSEVFSLVRNNVGDYSIVSSGVFTNLKTVLFVGNTNMQYAPGYVFAYRWNGGEIYINTFDFNNTQVDDILIDTSIEIRVYL